MAIATHAETGFGILSITPTPSPLEKVRIPIFILGTFGPISPQPVNHRSLEIPYYFQRSILRQIRQEEGITPENLWNGRANFVENRVKQIIESQYLVAEKVTMNKPFTPRSDLTVTLKDGFPLRKIKIEVKSSTLGIAAYKQSIRDRLPKGQRNADGIRDWMVQNGIILINGGKSDGKEKTPEEILNDSFYPQLERIMQAASRERDTEPSGQMILFPEKNQIQIWPDVPAATFTQPFL